MGEIKFFSCITLIFTILVFLIFAIADIFTFRQCNNFEEMTDIKTYYKHFDACYINTASGWQRWDEYKMRAATNESR
jgi:hypothetical protein